MVELLFLYKQRHIKVLLFRYDILKGIIDNIDSGNTKISEDDQLQIIELIQKCSSPQVSKIEAANYIGVSRATFDNYIQKGLIPKGIKRQGFNELFLNKTDLDKFLEKC